jgi:hypothetical protein
MSKKEKRLYKIIFWSFIPIISAILTLDFGVGLPYNLAIFLWAEIIGPIVIIICGIILLGSDFRRDVINGVIVLYLIIIWVIYFNYKLIQALSY